MKPEELDLEQFRSLRAEILRSMEDGNQVMAFGLTAMGLVLAAGVEARGEVLGFGVFAVALPLMGIIILSMWFAAQERVARASYFITGVEERLSLSVKGEPGLTWDRWLRRQSGSRKTNHFWSTEYSGVAIFMIMIVGSMTASCMAGPASIPALTRAAVLAVPITAVVGFSFSLARRMRRWSTWLSTSFASDA